MSQRWIRIILVILYCVGAVGMLIPETRTWFVKLSALNLFLSFVALILSRKENKLRFMVFLCIAFLIGFGAELIGVHTAYLFGSYQYGANLGVKWAEVPLIIGFNWGILAVTSSAVIHRVGLNKYLSAILSAMLMVVFDYILEPVAIKLDYWHWIEGQIPVFNFVCWFGVSLILQWIYQRMKLTELNKVAESLFLMMFIFFTLLTF
ncbi:MAG: carotenoid biosynthesis protein [Crocinitomicaceae bacterium]|jgi:putative membrane protein|nr:carotenoid biosynthesis protein [Crocinitomicaceae bacterium]